jgi:hypothetical protein
MDAVSKALAPISAFAGTINPILGLAISAITIYSGWRSLNYKVDKAAQIKEEKEAFDRNLAWSQEARDEADKTNRLARAYNHLGGNLANEYFYVPTGEQLTKTPQMRVPNMSTPA